MIRAEYTWECGLEFTKTFQSQRSKETHGNWGLILTKYHIFSSGCLAESYSHKPDAEKPFCDSPSREGVIVWCMHGITETPYRTALQWVNCPDPSPQLLALIAVVVFRARLWDSRVVTVLCCAMARLGLRPFLRAHHGVLNTRSQSLSRCSRSRASSQ